MEHLLQLSADSEIFVLTGAGISKESGIQTFRDQDGLWNNHRVEDVATPEAFYRNPSLVYEFYNKRRKDLNSGIKPNRAHNILFELDVKQLEDGSIEKSISVSKLGDNGEVVEVYEGDQDELSELIPNSKLLN